MTRTIEVLQELLELKERSINARAKTLHSVMEKAILDLGEIEDMVNQQCFFPPDALLKIRELKKLLFFVG